MGILNKREGSKFSVMGVLKVRNEGTKGERGGEIGLF